MPGIQGLSYCRAMGNKSRPVRSVDLETTLIASNSWQLPNFSVCQTSVMTARSSQYWLYDARDTR